MKNDFKKIVLIIFLLFVKHIYSQDYIYPWMNNDNLDISHRIKDIPIPSNFNRINSKPNSFQHWLQNLPLKENETLVRIFDGSLKGNQDAHFKIIDIDVGNKDLQQCADAVIRLYSEYLYSREKFNKIAFNFTSGDRSEFSNWVKGIRPIIKGNKVKWQKLKNFDNSYLNFRSYLNSIFTYAGSYSLSRELFPVNNPTDIKIGDIFIQGGFPGHAVIVVDLAVHSTNGKKIFLLAQSYMPAQEIHILQNYKNEKENPWYEVANSGNLETPEWTFKWKDLKRIK